MTKDEALALDLALEALENCTTWHLTREQFDKNVTAITAIKQARSAPVQEPVAIVDEDGVIVVCNYKYKPGDKLYTTPSKGRESEDCLTAAQQEIQRLSALVRAQQITIEKLEAQRPWTGLTDEDKLMCWARATHDADVEHKTEHQCLMDYGTEIEAKLMEKNT